MNSKFKHFLQKPITKFHSITWFWCILVVTVISVIFLIYYRIAVNPSWSDFLLNFGTEMIGVFVAVIFIDWVINKHESEKWIEIDEKVMKKINSVVGLILSDLMGATRLIRHYKIDENRVVKNLNGLLDIYWEIISEENYNDKLKNSLSEFEISHFDNLKRITDISLDRINNISTKYEFRLRKFPLLYSSVDNMVENFDNLKINLNIILSIGDTYLDENFDSKKTMRYFSIENVTDSLTKALGRLREIKRLSK